MSDWRSALLDTMRLPKTPANLKFLGTWQRWEGGATHNSATFNWLNTTHGTGPKINSVGVRAFPSFGEGIRYTAETLMNGRYDDIIDGLRKGDPYSHDVGAGLQTWVSGRPDGNPGYAARVLGQSSPPPVAHRAKAAATRVKTQVAAAKAAGTTDWDRAMKMIFDDDPEMAAIMAAVDDKTAQRAGIVSPRGSVRPPVVEDVGGEPVIKNLVQMVGSQIGKPYVFGSGPGTDSFDCSDLIQWAYKQIGVALPRTTFDQIHVGRSVKGKPLKPGDLVFPTGHHVVMYVGDGKVIAAPHTGTVVQYQPLSRFGSLLDVRRVL